MAAWPLSAAPLAADKGWVTVVMKLVVVAAMQRSGTTAICEALASHPDVRALGEIFHSARDSDDEPLFDRLRLNGNSNFHAFKTDLLSRDASLCYPSKVNQERILDSYLEYIGVDDDQWTLVDVKYNSWHHFNLIWHWQTAEPHLLTMLRERGAKLIHIRRADLLARHASEKIAIARRAYHIPAGETPPPIIIDLDPVEAVAAIREVQQLTELCASWFDGYMPRLDLTYESLFSAGHVAPDIVEKISALLDLPVSDSKFALTLEKAVPSPAECIGNWNKLVEMVELGRQEGLIL